jgi:hypothetical protein
MAFLSPYSVALPIKSSSILNIIYNSRVACGAYLKTGVEVSAGAVVMNCLVLIF